MSDGAIFETRDDAELWVSLNKADSNTNANNRVKALSNILTKMLSKEVTHDSRILCRMIEIIAAEEAEGWTEDVRDLVDLRRARDCRPVLAAARCFARKGLITDAETYLNEINDASDLVTLNMVKAELELAREEKQSANNFAITAWWSGKTESDLYKILNECGMNVNWSAFEACENLAVGLPYTDPVADGTPEYELFQIYKEWYTGSHDAATRMLISSSRYIDKDPHFCILSARMSRDEADWESCLMMFKEAYRSCPTDVCLQCEIGDAYLSKKEPDMALGCFRDAEAFDPGNPLVVRGIIDSYLALGKNGDVLHNVKEFLSSELATYQDFVKYSKILNELGYNDESKEYAERILYSHPADATACIILSRVALNEGDFRSAESYAKTGVSKNKKNPDSLAQLSKVCMALRRPGKAAKFAKRAVSADNTSLVALTALMEIYRDTGDNDRTVQACRSILEVDPTNNEAADILAKLELAKAIRESDSDESLPQVVGAEDFVRLIRTLIAEEKFSEAEKLCKDNDHRFGTVPEVRRLRGNAQYALGEYLKASSSFASAAVLMKGDAEVWHCKGLADEKFGDLDSAEEAFGKATLLDMYNSKYWISYGCVKEKKGDLDGAIKAFNRAIELDPRSSYALVRKAAILASSGMLAEALNFLELAEATDPRNPLILSVKLKVCLKSARYTDASIIGKKLMKKNPDSSSIAAYARACIGLTNYSDAKKILEKAIDDDPESLDLLTAYRDLYVAQGDKDGIIDICNEVLKIDPIDKTTKKILADALVQKGRSDEANVLYSSVRSKEDEGDESAPVMESEDPHEMYNIAKSMLAAGDLASAARLTDRAMDADPDNMEYALLRASIYRKTGDKRVADMFLSQYIERNPTNGSIHEAIGDMRMEDGDYKGAVSAYGKAVQSGIQKVTLYIKQGIAQEKVNAYTSATNSYSTAVMLDPHDAEANRHLAALQLRSKDYDAAHRSIQASLASEPCGEAYAILAQVCQGLKDRVGVRNAYQGFLRYEDADPEDIANVITALNSVGLRTEAAMLKNSPGLTIADTSNVADVPAEVKRASERIMRRAYMMGVDVNDPGISEDVDSNSEISSAAVSYLADLPVYGEVLYGTNECDYLENLSYNIINRGKNKDLEAVTIEAAFVAGGAKDSDEAKLLLSYVRAARISRLPREIPDQFMKIGCATSSKDSIEQIMLDNQVGVFTARMIQSCTKE